MQTVPVQMATPNIFVANQRTLLLRQNASNLFKFFLELTTSP